MPCAVDPRALRRLLHNALERLEKERDELKHDLEDVLGEAQVSASDVSVLRERLAASQSEAAAAERERAEADAELESLREAHALLQDEHDDLSAAADKLEETIADLEAEVGRRGDELDDKDEQLETLEDEVRALRQEKADGGFGGGGGGGGADGTPTGGAQREPLDEAPRRVEELEAKLLAEQDDADRRVDEARASQAKAVADAGAAADKAVRRLSEERTRASGLETSVADLEAEREKLRARMGAYERGVYGLREAVAEIDELVALLAARDADVREMTRERNRREEQLEELKYETEALRDRLGVPPGVGYDLSALRLRSQVQLESLRAQLLHAEDELGALEAERLDLKRKLRTKAIARGERAAQLKVCAPYRAVAARARARRPAHPPTRRVRAQPAASLRVCR